MRKPHLGILLKPASFDCNMACDYCYYCGVRSVYPNTSRPRMSLRVVDELCRQYRALEPSQIKLAWQGGEPTLMGLEFFQKAIEVENKNARPGDCWGNSLQTNGVVLDEEWCEFLARNRFLVGLSVDGPPELNSMRKLRNGRPGDELAMRALSRLKEHRCEFNILIVVSSANVDHPEQVFRFLVDNDLHFSQCIPCTEPAAEGKGLTAESITAAGWAEFMIRFFELWVENDDPTYYNRHIDNWLHLYFRLPPESCEYRPDCSNLLTIEWNGDVYPCDFFVEERYRMGNVLEDTLEHMLQGRRFRRFVSRAEEVPAACRECEWLWACNGGCYRQRGKLGIGQGDKPYMCEANKRIFSHVFGKFDELRASPVRPRLHAFLKELERKILGRAPGGPASKRVPSGSLRPGGVRGRDGSRGSRTKGSARRHFTETGRRAQGFE